MVIQHIKDEDGIRHTHQPTTLLDPLPTGELIQIRTKGQKNSSTYAFYATKHFVNILLGLNK